MSDPDVLVKTSACEIWRHEDGVALRFGRTIIILDVVEFAALAGSCRRATAKLFNRDNPTPVLRRGVRDLRLVVDNAEGLPDPST